MNPLFLFDGYFTDGYSLRSESRVQEFDCKSSIETLKIKRGSVPNENVLEI